MPILRPPYGLSYKRGDRTSANRSNGLVSSSQFIGIAGSFQNVAQVGSSFYGPSGSRRIRAETRVDVGHLGIYAPAFFGYSSAEVILNLRILDGSRVVAHDRRSLGRAISAVFWNSEIEASDLRVTLAAEFTGGGGRRYSTHVELETWVGAGGPFAYASTYCWANVDHINVRVL